MLKHQAITNAYPSLETLTIEKGKGERAERFEKTYVFMICGRSGLVLKSLTLDVYLINVLTPMLNGMYIQSHCSIVCNRIKF